MERRKLEGAAALSDKNEGMSTGYGNKNGVGEASVIIIGKGRVAHKAVEKIGDGYLSREEVGAMNEREAPSAELERVRLMIPRRRSTRRKKGSSHTWRTVKSPEPTRLRGGTEW